jgi:hypothetical protein
MGCPPRHERHDAVRFGNRTALYADQCVCLPPGSCATVPTAGSVGAAYWRGAVLAVDSLLVLILILMLAGAAWGWRRGYARFDVTTVVWVLVMVATLLVLIEPRPVRHAHW